MTAASDTRTELLLFDLQIHSPMRSKNTRQVLFRSIVTTPLLQSGSPPVNTPETEPGAAVAVKLTEAVRRKAYCVVMTSNIGSDVILEYRGGSDPEAHERMKSDVLGLLRKSFRPEFLNRVDDVVVFRGLSREDLRQIVEIQLGRIRERLAERHIRLELTDAAKDHFAAAGYDPVYGARPLKRLLQKEIETALARRILAGEIDDKSVVRIDAEGGELRFASEPLPEAA